MLRTSTLPFSTHLPTMAYYFVSFRARLANNTPGYVGLGCTTQDVTAPKNPIYAEFCNV